MIDERTNDIHFKSEHALYVKEAGGTKPNTTRWLDNDEWTAMKQLEALIDEAKTIVLTDADTSDFVRRQVTDIQLIAQSCGKYQVTFSFKEAAA